MPVKADVSSLIWEHLFLLYHLHKCEEQAPLLPVVHQLRTDVSIYVEHAYKRTFFLSPFKHGNQFYLICSVIIILTPLITPPWLTALVFLAGFRQVLMTTVYAGLCQTAVAAFFAEIYLDVQSSPD